VTIIKTNTTNNKKDNFATKLFEFKKSLMPDPRPPGDANAANADLGEYDDDENDDDDDML